MDTSIQANGEGPPILAADDKDAHHFKKGKSPGPDHMTMEETEALGDFGIEVITFLNVIYNGGYIPNDVLKSTLIALPKKQVL